MTGVQIVQTSRDQRVATRTLHFKQPCAIELSSLESASGGWCADRSVLKTQRVATRIVHFKQYLVQGDMFAGAFSGSWRADCSDLKRLARRDAQFLFQAISCARWCVRARQQLVAGVQIAST